MFFARNVIASALCLLVSTGCTSSSSKPRGPEVHPSSPAVEVRHARGLDASRVRALVAPSLASLHQCAPGSGGKINVEITVTEGAIHAAVEPSPSLNPLLRECVLQALSTIDVDQSGGDIPGVSVPPSGFTSLLAIWW